MATEITTTTTVTDDIDGTKDATEVLFSYQGADYSIDLAKKNVTAFEKVLQPYIEAARKTPRRTSSTRRKSSSVSAARQDLGQIREWAREQGIDVSQRGRVSASVIEQYDAVTK